MRRAQSYAHCGNGTMFISMKCASLLIVPTTQMCSVGSSCYQEYGVMVTLSSFLECVCVNLVINILLFPAHVQSNLTPSQFLEGILERALLCKG